jgi:hypothetical protein
MSAVLPVTLGRSVSKVAWGDGNAKRSLVAVGIISDRARDTSEVIEERSPGVERSAVAGIPEGKVLGSSTDSDKTLLGSKASLIRLETLESAGVGMAIDADCVTSIVGIDDSKLSLSPKIVLWGTEMIWADVSMISVGSVPGTGTRSELRVSLTEVIMLGTSVVTIGVELGSNTAKEVGNMPYVVISATGSTPARVDSGVRDVSWDPSTESVSVAGDMIMADGTFSSEDNPNVADKVSWENGETVISAAISTLPVLRTLLALEMMEDMISPWFGSFSSKLFGVGCVSEVRLVETDAVLEADAACSVVW